MNQKRNGDPDILFPHDRHGRPPKAWLIESPTTGKVFMTEKPDVAEKRYMAQDHVTPYHSQNEPDSTERQIAAELEEEDEL